MPKMSVPVDQLDESTLEQLGREFVDAVEGKLPPDVVATAAEVFAGAHRAPRTSWPRSVGAYAKAFLPAFLSAGYALQSALDGGGVDGHEWQGIGLGLLLSCAVAIVPNAKASD